LERDKAEKVADETFEDRMEDAAHKGIEQLRHRFEEVTLRTGLRNNTELSSELAEMLTRPGKSPISSGGGHDVCGSAQYLVVGQLLAVTRKLVRSLL